ncbi:nucleotidyltransferase family protein [Arachidicoccus sp.]|uniref:nucleotidyltransferase family protein n=1 Tax=Arachidicoccus sp. TaxID=1872624 RepID=UPI003D209390
MNELIILAGGLGTRLRSEVPDLPKCMAPVNGKPFINFVMDYFLSQKIEKFIFALGYKSELLQNHLIAKYAKYTLQFSLEEEPLGTGGAIQLACRRASKENVFITNGDTLFKVETEMLAKTHLQKNAECTLALKPMENFDRFGAVEIDDNSCIESFQEKKHYGKGLINGGFYALNVESFLHKNFGNKFSFEKDYLERFISQKKLFASVQDAYFIDMGIPEDYRRAAVEL